MSNTASSNSQLEGRLILITGASRGIGRDAAIACAAAGAELISMRIEAMPADSGPRYTECGSFGGFGGNTVARDVAAVAMADPASGRSLSS